LSFGFVAVSQRLCPNFLKLQGKVPANGKLCQFLGTASNMRGKLRMAKKRPELAQMDELGRRSQKDRRTSLAAKAAEERRDGTGRRRHIDPTTCERDYSEDELEFMRAVDEYKRKNRRMFPTCSELLEVLRGLGYQKLDANANQPASTAAPVGILNSTADSPVLV